MIRKTFTGEKIFLQDSTVIQKDTISISNHLDSLVQEVDSTEISQPDYGISIRIISDTTTLPVIAGERKITINTFPFQGSMIPQQDDNIMIINNILGGEDIPYFFEKDTVFIRDQNFLNRFSCQYFSTRDTSHLIYRQQQNANEYSIHEQFNIGFKNTKTPGFDLSPDWLMGIVVFSLMVIAWLKFFYHKFFDHIITSLWNYQLSRKEFRDHNIFARRVSFILNLNFILIGALYIYLVLNHFHINPFQLKPFLFYLSLTGILTIILLIRHILILSTGHIFNRQKYFKEYLHQILLIYKNIGIYFIPFVLGIAYIHENLRIYLIIISLALFIIGYLFRFIRGIQIIINKDVLIFYLILYLCTLEILPVVIYCKFFSSWL